MSQTTKKVQIALCIDRQGDIGVSPVLDGDTEDALRWASDHLLDGEARYIVEVEVALPTVPTIQATAEPA